MESTQSNESQTSSQQINVNVWPECPTCTGEDGIYEAPLLLPASQSSVKMIEATRLTVLYLLCSKVRSSRLQSELSVYRKHQTKSQTFDSSHFIL